MIILAPSHSVGIYAIVMLSLCPMMSCHTFGLGVDTGSAFPFVSTFFVGLPLPLIY